jgi:archaemetzincin
LSAREVLFIFYEPEIDSSELKTAVEALEKTNLIEIELADELCLFESCFNRARRQYEAGCLLDKFRVAAGKLSGKKLWLVSKDLYIPGNNFVFGLAELEGELGIVSTIRLKTGALGKPGYFKRLRTEVIHEVFHLLGLGHCSNPYCVMYFSNSLIDSDRKGEEPCAVCAEKLRLRYGN